MRSLPLILSLLLAPAARGEVVVPFELVKNQILVEVRLGESGPYNMILDTGVVPSGISLTVARELGLLTSEEPAGYASGVGGDKVPIYAARIEGLAIGALEPEPVDAAALDNSGLAEKLGRPFHGILGDAFLSRHAVRIDYPARTLTFDPAPREPAPGSYAVALERVENDIIPLLRELRVDGVVVPVSLDTGSSLVLELYPEGAERAGIEAIEGEGGTVTGARGDEQVKAGRARTLELGPLVIEDQEVTLSTGRRSGAGRQGNLGNGFLKHFVLTVDYPAGMLLIEPVEDAIP